MMHFLSFWMQESSKTNNNEDLPGQEGRISSRETTTNSISEVDKTLIAVGGGIRLGIASVIVKFKAKTNCWDRGHRRVLVVCGHVGLLLCLCWSMSM